jgi:nitronate monooxygenase
MKTPLCDLLGVDHPIVQSGMGRVAGPEMVAEVCNAGAFGILAGLGLAPEELRRQIRRVRELTDRPFGVNLWLNEQLMPPVDPLKLPASMVASVQSTLNVFRGRLGLEPTMAPPPPYPDTIAAAIDVIVEERVRLWSIGLGNPPADVVDRCHRAGILVMPMVATVEDARTVSAAGVDLIVAQGGEAGGHRSTWKKAATPTAASIGTIALVPQIVDAVKQPVVAAGGIADGRGVVAAIALGAQGVLLGTRFVATRESMAPPIYKNALLASGGGETTITDAFSGLYARAVRSRFSAEYEASGAPVLPSLLQTKAAEDIYVAAAKAGDREYFPMWAGQSVGLVSDLPGAAEVVRRIVAEVDDVIARFNTKS